MENLKILFFLWLILIENITVEFFSWEGVDVTKCVKQIWTWKENQRKKESAHPPAFTSMGGIFRRIFIGSQYAKQNGCPWLSRFAEAWGNCIAQACFCESVQWSSVWVKFVSSLFMSQLFHALQKLLAICAFKGRFYQRYSCFSQSRLRKVSWSTDVPLGLLLVGHLWKVTVKWVY